MLAILGSIHILLIESFEYFASGPGLAPVLNLTLIQSWFNPENGPYLRKNVYVDELNLPEVFL